MLDRLQLTEQRVASMAAGIEQIAALPDPIGGISAEWTRPNGLVIQRVRVPLGVIGIIYESRPNVTADAGALCLRAANAVVQAGDRVTREGNVPMTAGRFLASATDVAQLVLGLRAGKPVTIADIARVSDGGDVPRSPGGVDDAVARGGRAGARIVAAGAVPRGLGGDGEPRVYEVEPTGEFENDPNVTDKRFPGNPTRSYRSTEPLRVVAEVTDWTRLTPEQLQGWRDRLAQLRAEDRDVIIN